MAKNIRLALEEHPMAKNIRLALEEHTMAKNIRGINKMIAAVHPGYELVQYDGYVAIYGPDTHEWYSSSVAVCKVSHMTPEQWVREVTEAIANKNTQPFDSFN